MTAISLPITDRRQAHDFYVGAFGLEAVGPTGPDGLPEPLRFDVAGTQILLVPTGGFDWAIGPRALAPADQIRCLLTFGVADDGAVDEHAAQAEAAGGTTLLAPTRQPWGMYAATVTDPDDNPWVITSQPLP